MCGCEKGQRSNVIPGSGAPNLWQPGRLVPVVPQHRSQISPPSFPGAPQRGRWSPWGSSVGTEMSVCVEEGRMVLLDAHYFAKKSGNLCHRSTCLWMGCAYNGICSQVHFSYSLPLKMAVRIQKYAEICRNCLPGTSHACPRFEIKVCGTLDKENSKAKFKVPLHILDFAQEMPSLTARWASRAKILLAIYTEHMAWEHALTVILHNPICTI